MTGDQKSSFKLSGLELKKKLLQNFALDAVYRFTAKIMQQGLHTTYNGDSNKAMAKNKLSTYATDAVVYFYMGDHAKTLKSTHLNAEE